MSFRFHWPNFDMTAALEKGLNKSPLPGNICDAILVKSLDLGTQPPEIEIMEIGELCKDKFRGIFRMVYNGNAHLVLQTKVQANPVCSSKRKKSFRLHPHYGVIAANKPLVVPMELRLSDLRLNGIFSLVFCEQKGVTFCFKNDPLDQINVSSTFDTIPSIKRLLQYEIETLMRQLFNEELPFIIHELSLQRNHLNSSMIRRQSSAQSLRSDNGSVSTDDIPMAKIKDSMEDSSGFFIRDGIIHRIYLSPGKHMKRRHQYIRWTGVDMSDEIHSDIFQGTNRKNIHTPILINEEEKVIVLGDEAPGLLSLSQKFPNEKIRKNLFFSSKKAVLKETISIIDIPGKTTTDPTHPTDFVINPQKNIMASRMMNLFKKNQTISTFSPVVQHAAFRSHPVVKDTKVKRKPIQIKGRTKIKLKF
ncbi:hypothetical protein ROZALSC1DRAFT_28326 [Rozella allomycis CSF55]|uniref:SMP-LTD domain-containing protein n=1 Tax=Rozella allomycis (strain CSF55) TaxID=988480 RepID=A0A075AWH4_ROZAC|nr:hypothetical protein O9G_002832 [Rozella allomycis CSF55]RKP20163.1 hypothetical protein ROZALSC1DRAFT_28326 [Rozella allomycis CSF55]|eukprot:EPZ32914.1 hypothetical protein O9G_002832 [Rozella allomycis CSF55]